MMVTLLSNAQRWDLYRWIAGDRPVLLTYHKPESALRKLVKIAKNRQAPPTSMSNEDGCCYKQQDIVYHTYLIDNDRVFGASLASIFRLKRWQSSADT